MNDTSGLRVWALGGDERCAYTVAALREGGLPVKAYGVPGLESEADCLEHALSGAELALLPMRAFHREDLVIGMERIPWALLPGIVSEDAFLIAGVIPEEAEIWLSSQGIRCRSVLELDSYQTRNAAVTAEGAIMIALDAMRRTVQGAKILIVGWGRIGKALSFRLSALGADVTVSARRESHLAEIESFGMRSDRTGTYFLGLEYDLIVNTVPSQVISKEQITSVPADTVLMELASAPGGFPDNMDRHVIVARGLPGKTAPRTAGEQLAEAVWECLTGEGRALE